MIKVPTGKVVTGSSEDVARTWVASKVYNGGASLSAKSEAAAVEAGSLLEVPKGTSGMDVLRDIQHKFAIGLPVPDGVIALIAMQQ